ncbi:MAG TPA: hypothetical protein VNC78_02025 [Actinomycetota bacterium]|nr:hypothetical protein [Actinomycetota bacterium]
MKGSWIRALAFFAIGAVVALATPAVARTVADVARFARNSHRVDGLHAVGADAILEDRRRRLVATDDSGYLPENIITRAPDAKNLGGRIPDEYEETTCEVGVVVAKANVESSIGGEYASVPGTAYRDTDPPPIPWFPKYGCDIAGITARRTTTGIYHVDFDSHRAGLQQPPSCPPDAYEVIVTVRNLGNAPLIANTSTICDERSEAVEEVRIYDLQGSLRDASFTIVLLSELPMILYP